MPACGGDPTASRAPSGAPPPPSDAPCPDSSTPSSSVSTPAVHGPILAPSTATSEDCRSSRDTVVIDDRRQIRQPDIHTGSPRRRSRNHRRRRLINDEGHIVPTVGLPDHRHTRRVRRQRPRRLVPHTPDLRQPDQADPTARLENRETRVTGETSRLTMCPLLETWRTDCGPYVSRYENRKSSRTRDAGPPATAATAPTTPQPATPVRELFSRRSAPPTTHLCRAPGFRLCGRTRGRQARR